MQNGFYGDSQGSGYMLRFFIKFVNDELGLKNLEKSRFSPCKPELKAIG
jgi:hypothetical protein